MSEDTNTVADIAAIRAQLASSEKSAVFWRWAGGLAASAAITMGGYAIDLGNTAAVDHSRVEWLMAQERAAGDRMERLLEAQTRTIAQLEQLQATVADLRTDVRDLRGAERRENGDRR